MRVLLSTYDSRGGVEPLAGPAVRLRAGAAQVVVPRWADQPYWARRVAGLGIGIAQDVRNLTTESLSAGLRTALASQIRARARAVAATIRTDGTTVAAGLLADAVSRGRPPVSA